MTYRCEAIISKLHLSKNTTKAYVNLKCTCVCNYCFCEEKDNNILVSDDKAIILKKDTEVRFDSSLLEVVTARASNRSKAVYEIENKEENKEKFRIVSIEINYE